MIGELETVRAKIEKKQESRYCAAKPSPPPPPQLPPPLTCTHPSSKDNRSEAISPFPLSLLLTSLA